MNEDEWVSTIEWESSEALRAALRAAPPLRGLRCLELGAGAGAASLVAQRDAGADVVASDREPLALARLRERGLNVLALDWGDKNFTEAFPFVFGSELFYRPECAAEVVGLVRRVGARVALFTSGPLRGPFAVFAAEMAVLFRATVVERVAPPGCEPCLMLVAGNDPSDPLFACLTQFVRTHRQDPPVAVIVSAPTPPPPPPAGD